MIFETILSPFYHCYVRVNEGPGKTTWGFITFVGAILLLETARLNETTISTPAATPVTVVNGMNPAMPIDAPRLRPITTPEVFRELACTTSTPAPTAIHSPAA